MRSDRSKDVVDLPNNSAKLPQNPQPDIVSARIPLPNPSIITYFILTLLGLVLVAISFSIRPDLPALLVNLGTSLFSAVVLLVFIDQRLRQSEIAALRNLPNRVGHFVGHALSPRRKQLFRFCSLQLAALEKLLQVAIVPTSLHELARQTGSFLLLGAPGSGKTTTLQILCAQRSREYLADETRPIPILYPLRYWPPGLGLEEAILSHMRTFSPITRRSLTKTLGRYPVTLILDGADEMPPGLSDQLKAELDRLMRHYPRTDWIISSRSAHSEISPGLPIVDLPPPSSAEVREIVRRLGDGGHQ
jgi:hypothetical protein